MNRYGTIVTALSEGYNTRQELVDATGFGINKVQKLLAELQKQGRVKKTYNLNDMHRRFFWLASLVVIE